MDTPNAAYGKEMLDLQPHPEGGRYKEVYRADGQVSRSSSPGIIDKATPGMTRQVKP